MMNRICAAILMEASRYRRFSCQCIGLALVLSFACGFGGVSAGAASGLYHSADSTPNWKLSLPELLRVIQFFNSDGLHCAANPDDTEDGYAPGSGEDTGCAAHDSDYAPDGPDWQINLTELLRCIQFFNAGGYHFFTGTEDGFRPGSGGIGVEWVRGGESVPWAPRYGYNTLAFDNHVWVMAGTSAQSESRTYLNDIWKSADGCEWTQVTAAAPWRERTDAAAAVFGGKLWILGGSRLTSLSDPDPLNDYLNDVWYSSDGSTWEEATAGAPWAPRGGHQSVVFDGKLWVIGGEFSPDGESADPFLNDVWYSNDGVEWEQASAVGMPLTRTAHVAFAFDGKLWVAGGWGSQPLGAPYGDWEMVRRNDVWSSADGMIWNQEVEVAPWAPRMQYPVVPFAQKLWMLGGYDYTTGDAKAGLRNDVWQSADGAHWVRTIDHAAWSPRRWHAAVVHQDRIWVLPGYESTDIWYTPVAPASVR